MEETLFDRHGTPIAYIDHDDEATIYLWDGTPVAYLSDSNTIYGFNGRHLGWFDEGTISNLDGEKCGFIKDTLSVHAKYEPYKSYKKFKPYKSFKEYSKYKPHYKHGNSNESLFALLNKGKK